MEEYSLMELFINPATVESLSTSDKLAGAAITTLMGMGITFCVLLLLWGIIAVLSRFVGTEGKKKETSVASAGKLPVASATGFQAASVVSGQDMDNGELIAILAAAIAAYEGGTVTSDLVVRRIKRVSGGMTSWSSAGYAECIESRRVY